MTISYTSSGSIILSSKNHSVELGSTVRLGSFEIPGPGEYDVASLQCEAHALSEGLVYFLHMEDLAITYITKLNAEVAKLDDASSTNILVAYLDSEAVSDQLKPIIKSVEPSYVALTGPGATPEFSKDLGIPQAESSSLKITYSALPEEGTYLLPLP